MTMSMPQVVAHSRGFSMWGCDLGDVGGICERAEYNGN